MNPAMAYHKLVAEIATTVGDQGLYDVKNLRALSPAERSQVLLANPDVVNDFAFESEQMAQVLAGEVDARLWFSAAAEGALRRWLFEDVCAEITRDAQIVEDSARDPALCGSEFL